nr:AIF_HP1_G0030700.mRNA.1.CDS.1 [Saccharomyces cerevisiae]
MQKYVKPNEVSKVSLKPNNDRILEAIIPSMEPSPMRTPVNLIINHIKPKLEPKSNEHLRERIKLRSSPAQDVLNRNIRNPMNCSPPTNFFRCILCF